MEEMLQEQISKAVAQSAPGSPALLSNDEERVRAAVSQVSQDWTAYQKLPENTGPHPSEWLFKVLINENQSTSLGNVAHSERNNILFLGECQSGKGSDQVLCTFGYVTTDDRGSLFFNWLT